MIERLKRSLPDVRRALPLMLLFAVTLLLIIFFVWWFVAQERYIYFWDSANFITLYRDLADKFLHRPLKALDSINVSMRKADYNNVGTIPLLPFYYLFGDSRIVFIFSIAVVYGFSTIIFFPVLLKRITGYDYGAGQTGKVLFFTLGILTLGLWPQLWVPIMLGYYDVAGVGVIFLILYFYLRKNLSEQNWKELVRLGLLVFLLVILRRWYSYWTIGFFAAVTIREIFVFFEDKTGIKSLKLALRNILIIGATAALVFFALATQIAIKMLKTDYADIYSAYRHNANRFEDLEKLYAHFGLIIVALCVLGFITMLAKKKLRRDGIFLGVIFVVAFYSFTRTQDIDLHHYNWVISILVIFAGVFIVEVYKKLAGKLLKAGLIVILLLVGLINLSIVFSPKAESYLNPVAFALAKVRLAPKVRNDLDQIHQLLTTLNDLTRDSDKKVYVLSSSISLNSSILINGCDVFEPDLRPLKERIFMSSDVDKRDGFPFQIYKADYVVVADPPGYHLLPEDQKVVVVLAEQFLNRQTIGSAYAKLPFESTLDDGRRIFIYRKERKFRADELLNISRMFSEFYPNNKEKFEINPEMIKELSEN
jgi:hypothetical protein